MSEAKKLFTDLVANVQRLGRLIQGKERDAANKVRQLRPAPTNRARSQVMQEYTQATNEIGGRTWGIRDHQRRIDALIIRCDELRAEDSALEKAEAAKPVVAEAPAVEPEAAKEPA